MIRAMEHEDVEEIHRLGVEAEEFHSSEKEAEESPFRPKPCLHNWVDSGDVLLVDEVKDQIRGFVLTSFHRPTGQVTINNVYVVEEYRRQGIASALLDEALERVQDEKDARYLCAHVKPNVEASRSLFSDHGFREGETFLWMERFVGE